MDHFSYKDYKEFVTFLIKNGKGRGEFSRIAAYLKVSNVLISQVFKGHKELSVEQGIKLAEYYGFSEIETKYFINCLSYNKAGNQQLKSYYEKEMFEIAKRSKQIASRVTTQRQLTDEEKARYFSDWVNSAIHLSCSLPFINTIQDLSLYLGLAEEKIDESLQFLLAAGLVERKSGELVTGTIYIHLEKTSPYLIQHHRNWRLLSSLKATNIQAYEVMYTAPMVISKKLAEELYTKILYFIQNVVKSTESCADEEIWNLNIDFIKLEK